ncbi:MAG: hypothetical protein ABJN69_14435 [Hellea sp.]
MRRSILLASFATLLANCQTSTANHNHSEISNPIERVRAAYQVDRLRDAKTIRLEDDIRQNYPDHDFSPDFHEMSAQRRHYIIDLKNKAGSSEFLTEITGTYYHGRAVLQDGKSQYIIYPSSVYQDQGETEFLSEYGPVMRASDVMLAIWLDEAADNARLEGKEMWSGQFHDKITFDLPNSPPLTILVQEDTGYISKMSRSVGEILVSYVFNYHDVQNGIPIAKEHNLYINDERIYFSFNRNLVLNDKEDQKAFEVEADITLEPQRVDQSIMTAEAVTDATYQVGQNDSYTSFIRTPSGLIAFGVEAGFADRLKAYREASDDTSPLAYAVVANHHNVRLRGASEAIAAGATLLVTPDAQSRVRSAIADATSTPDQTIEVVPASKTIGSVNLYNLETSNASANLVAFNEADKALIQTAHYSAPFVDAPLWAELNGATLMQKINALGISPAYIVSTDSKRIESWDAFETALDNFDYKKCYRNRRICKGLG